jgi:hypothetical protein
MVTVVGSAAEIIAGEWLTVSGTWVYDREHGQQFKASFLRALAPHHRRRDREVPGLGSDPRHRPDLRR